MGGGGRKQILWPSLCRRKRTEDPRPFEFEVNTQLKKDGRYTQDIHVHVRVNIRYK